MAASWPADASFPGGVWVAPATGGAFVQTGITAVHCLTWTTSGMYACGTDDVNAFSVGVSHDNGAHFVGLYRRAQTKQVDCPNTTTTGDVCPAA